MTMRLPFQLGTDYRTNEEVVLDLADMPHLLVAGTTGSGKSVFLNSVICDLMRSGPSFMLFDPKRVEFFPYRDLVPVYTDDEATIQAIHWLSGEMDARFLLLEGRRVRDIDQYNAERPLDDRMRRIVVVIDELANLMLLHKARVEVPLTRVLQMARAVGIHAILATQRPTVDIITGLMKANVPARVAFGVISATDSRVILDEEGAENITEKGQMLARIPGEHGLKLLQGRLTTLDDVNREVALYT